MSEFEKAANDLMKLVDQLRDENKSLKQSNARLLETLRSIHMHEFKLLKSGCGYDKFVDDTSGQALAEAEKETK
ncbi:MAG: hypothetical protein IMZ53_06255 [Thermoplasmata archaeon]|nr:hypothetical protein [Thermoplasmata archaeon]